MLRLSLDLLNLLLPFLSLSISRTISPSLLSLSLHFLSLSLVTVSLTPLFHSHPVLPFSYFSLFALPCYFHLLYTLFSCMGSNNGEREESGDRRVRGVCVHSVRVLIWCACV
ncbi:MAG: hypothetical protein JOS17DRAFT_404634 [Linnemannia elongata]|nr:MAG: hypothetical protein JOS17DRAFT_404634 [Linnemannia elongata]